MDFFERAHVKRNTEKKDTKSEIVIKKQLKQMLCGYKENDSKLIKTCIRCKSDDCDSQHCFDDSSSVSGFSDLNLTNSSCEAVISSDILPSSSKNDHSTDVKLNESLSNCSLNDGEEKTMDSISELSDSMESLSEDSQDRTDNMILRQHINTYQSAISDSNSSPDLIFSSSDSEVALFSNSEEDSLSNHSSVSGEFDPDGVLATKILEKLRKKDKTETNKSKKRKLDNVKESSFDVESISNSAHLKGKVKSYNKTPPQSDEDYEFNDSYFNTNKQDTFQDINDVKNRSDDLSGKDSESGQSSPYISVTAENAIYESLNEILWEYRHPTVRNLPSNSGIVPTESMSVDIDNVEINEQNSDLFPKIHDDHTIQDLDVSEDVSTEPTDKNVSVCNTMDSESFERQTTEDDADNVELTNSIEVYISRRKTCVFVIKHPGRLYVHGKVKVKAIFGKIEVSGYTLRDEWCDIYAPNYSYAQCLKTVENTNSYNILFDKLTAIGIDMPTADGIMSSLDKYDGVIAMSQLDDCSMDFVDNNFSITDVFSMQSRHVENSLKQACETLGCTLYLKTPARVLATQPVWDEIASCGFEPESRGVICGGKGIGKSTTLRYCVNKLLSKGPVLVVDLDPGQAEFTVAGNVSATVVDKPLLGLNFTHLRKPERMLNIGMINTMDNPYLYLDAVSSIITYCNNNEQLKKMPWLVNTMGLCNNIGLKILICIILRTIPTYVLQMDSKQIKKRFDYELNRDNVSQNYYTIYRYDSFFKNVEFPDCFDYTFFMLPPTENFKNVFSIAPRDERYLNFLAYFGQLLAVHNGCGILDIVPYEVNIKDLQIVTNVIVPLDSITKVLNGKIVALCHQGADRGTTALQDKALLCVGHGLIRGVDCEKGVLYILTPTPVAALCQVDTIAYTDWVPELRGHENNLPPGLAVPYRTAVQYGQRALMSTPRRRFNPLQLLKMSRNT